MWVKWPVPALWQSVAPAKETAWLIWPASHRKAFSARPALTDDEWKRKTLSQRQTGSLYLCEPASVGGSWGAGERRMKYHTCTGLPQPTPDTFQTLHLQRKQTVKTGSGGVLLQLKVRNTHSTHSSAFWVFFVRFCWCQITSASSDEKLCCEAPVLFSTSYFLSFKGG